jgi:hypothetical protein
MSYCLLYQSGRKSLVSPVLDTQYLSVEVANVLVALLVRH